MKLLVALTILISPVFTFTNHFRSLKGRATCHFPTIPILYQNVCDTSRNQGYLFTHSSHSDTLSETRAYPKKGNKLSRFYEGCMGRFIRNPFSYLSIPIFAAFVGYITNWIGVKMLFYPINWIGIPIFRWNDQPLGLIGWQGVIPTKRFKMSRRLVDVTISRLLNIADVFSKMDPNEMAKLISPTFNNYLIHNKNFIWLTNIFIKRICNDIIKQIDQILNIKEIVITGLTNNPAILGTFFQTVGYKELNYLINSGLGFGFLLGIFQMFQWLAYPKEWTLPFAGALIGFVTNWIALKWIFEPLEPMKFGPLILHGMFLKRQKEVSYDFSKYISNNILSSTQIWPSMFQKGSNSLNIIRNIIHNNIPISKYCNIDNKIIEILQLYICNNIIHPIHKYTDKTLQLQSTLVTALNKLSSKEFEKVLHPVFQEDEIILIIAGGVLGAISGYIQIYMNRYVENWIEKNKIKNQQQQQQQQQQLNDIIVNDVTINNGNLEYIADETDTTDTNEQLLDSDPFMTPDEPVTISSETVKLNDKDTEIRNTVTPQRWNLGMVRKNGKLVNE